MHAFVRLAKTYIRPYWAFMLGAIVLTSMAGLSPFLFTFMGKTIVDDVLQIKAGGDPAGIELSRDDPVSPFSGRDFVPPDSETETSTLDASAMAQTGKTPGEKVRVLLLFFAAYVAIHLLVNVFRWVSRYNIGLMGQKIVFKLRSDLHSKLQSLQLTYFDQAQTGKLMARIIDDVHIIRTRTTNLVIGFATNLVMLVVGSIILFSINWRMAVVATCCLPLYAISYQFFVKRVREHTKRARVLNARIYGLLQQRISGIRLVKSFVREKGEMLRYHRLAKAFFRTRLSRSILQALLGGIAMGVSGVGTALVLWYGATLVRRGQLTLGEMLFFYGSVVLLFRPVIQLADTVVIVQWLAVVISRVFEILDEDVKIKDHPDAVSLEEVRGLIEFENVSLIYDGKDPRLKADDDDHGHGRGRGHGHGHHHHDDRDERDASANNDWVPIVALRDVTLRIEPGELVCIMGSSGSGKSSFMNLLPRLYEPSKGRVTIDGHDLSKVKLTSLRRHIGLVPQESSIFSGTIADNIRYGEPYASLEDIIEASKAAELHGFVEDSPDKYETKVGEQGITLSGGQKQRISLARALLTRPRVLLLDDCTSALDAKTEARVLKTLQKVLTDHTAIVVTHRTSMAMKADRIVIFDDGKIIEEGTHDQLLQKRGYYWRIFKSQNEGMWTAQTPTASTQQ